MARAIGNFTVQNPGEVEPFGFDFTTQLPPGDVAATLTGWSAKVVVGVDAGAQAKLGQSSLSGNITVTKFGPALPGVEYVLSAAIVTLAGYPLVLWAPLIGEDIGGC